MLDVEKEKSVGDYNKLYYYRRLHAIIIIIIIASSLGLFIGEQVLRNDDQAQGFQER